MSCAVVERLVHPYHQPVYLAEEEVASFVEHARCPCCGAPGGFAPLVELGRPAWRRRVVLVECAACGLVFYRNPPSEAAIRSYYETTFNRTRGERPEGFGALPAKASRRMARFVADLGLKDPATRFLDVGCGVGSQLAGLGAAGFSDLFGTELSRHRAAVSRRRFPGRIFEGGWQSVPPDLRFDVIYSNHVFEHLFRPAEAFARLAGQLSERGVLLVTVPDAWLEDVAVQVLFLPHLHSFAERSLAALGRRHGFDCLFWRGARVGESSAVFFRDPAHLCPDESRFRHRPEPEALPPGGQVERIGGPWLARPGRRHSFYRYLIPLEEASTRGFAECGPFERALARGLIPVHGLLHRVGADRLRRPLGKRGYLELRHEPAPGAVPIVGAPGDQAVFFVK